MVTMVYPDSNHEGLSIAKLLREWVASGALFTGPRSFTLWSMAVAYALLPADPNIAYSYPAMREWPPAAPTTPAARAAPSIGCWLRVGVRRAADR